MLHPYTQGTLITATVPLSRQLRSAYDTARREAGSEVWESPDIVSRSAWLTRLWREYSGREPLAAPLLLTPLQNQALWEEAIRASAAALGDAAALLDRRATVSAAIRAWDLLQSWEAELHPSEFEQTAESAAFAGWKHAVERKLRENGWIAKSQLPRAITGLIAAGDIEMPGPMAYTGFHRLSPADRRWFAACRAVERPLGKSFDDALRSRASCESSLDELTRAAAWARAKLEKRPRARIGIVVRGLAEQAAVANRVFSEVLHPGLALTQPGVRRAFHISAGVAASEQPLIAAALLILGLKTGLSLSEAGVLLRSPFHGLARVQGARLDADLRRQGVEKVSLQIEAVHRAFPIFAKAAGEGPERQRPSQWSVVFSRLLSKARWPGPRTLSPAECDAIEDWKALLSELASLDLVVARLDYAQALARLQEIARAPRSQASDDRAPVQILDLREAAGTRWDALWIAGLDAASWPPPPRPNPFLPLAMQRAAGMPHSSPEQELADARQLMADLLTAAPEVMCSYARSSGEERLQSSALIAMLTEETDITMAPDTSLQGIFETGTELEVQPPDQAPPLPEGTQQRGGASLLKNQAACPFRAFAVHRLGVRQPDEADLGISAAERGSVAHHALELLWRELKTRQELLDRREEIPALITRCVSAALDARLSRRHGNPSLDRARDLEQARWERLVAEWIEEERARPDFEVIEVETMGDVEVGGVKLQVKADRIDKIIADGSIAILDYKTSDRFTRQSWDGPRPDEPQLPLYAVKKRVDAAYFAKLSLGSIERLGYEGADFIQHRQEWEPVLENLGASFLRGDAAVDPKKFPQTCEFCHLHLLCRISELKTGAGAATDGADE